MNKKQILIRLSFLVLFIAACSTGINLFTKQDEVRLGKQFDQQIEEHPEQYPIYKNEAVKKYIKENIFDEVLKSSAIKNKNVYNYEMEIIDDDSTLNAFAVPGGYIYLYTGLIKYLDSEAALAGVISHEIAHVEERHSTEQMSNQYGLQMLAGLVLGNDPGQLEVIAANLVSGLTILAHSRSSEDEADKRGVEYLQNTRFYPGSVKFFFEKMRADGLVNSKQSGIQTFLSTHPDPIARIEETNKRLEEKGLPVKSYTAYGDGIYRNEYQKNILSRMK